jgi:uncharacterized membrane protein
MNDSDTHATTVNVGNAGRWASIVAGSAVAALGIARLLRHRSVGGAGALILGSWLVQRGVTGFCRLCEVLGIGRANGSGTVTGNLGVKIDRSITVAAPVERVFRLWRNLENLPRFMPHLERVTATDDRRSRWEVRTPAGGTVAWDAEIINERPNELIAWRSIGNPSVTSAGSVRFEPTPDGRGTRLDVSLQYDPPGGTVGHSVASLLGGDAGHRIEEDLEQFKRRVESGELR